MAEQKKQSPENPKIIGNYMIGKTIGEGTFGKVKLGIHLPTEEKVAVKILQKNMIVDEGDVARVSREIQILKQLRHPNLIQLYEIIETQNNIYLIMEFCGKGELFDYIVQNKRLKEPEAAKFFRQLINGIEQIHRLGIVHRDLKPENLLLDHNLNIKIVDFGLSNTYKPGEMLKTACGSPCYAAPEMIAGKLYNGLEVDIWSSGIILFAAICGYLPFEDPDTAKLYKKIRKGDFIIPPFISKEGKDFLRKILVTDPARRYTIPQIKKHPWFTQVQNKLERGIIMGIDEIEINQEIFNLLEGYNLDAELCRKNIMKNKHNNNTATYYLLLKKHVEGGEIIQNSTSQPQIKQQKSGEIQQRIRDTQSASPNAKLMQSRKNRKDIIRQKTEDQKDETIQSYRVDPSQKVEKKQSLTERQQFSQSSGRQRPQNDQLNDYFQAYFNPQNIVAQENPKKFVIKSNSHSRNASVNKTDDGQVSRNNHFAEITQNQVNQQSNLVIQKFKQEMQQKLKQRHATPDMAAFRSNQERQQQIKFITTNINLGHHNVEKENYIKQIVDTQDLNINQEIGYINQQKMRQNIINTRRNRLSIRMPNKDDSSTKITRLPIKFNENFVTQKLVQNFRKYKTNTQDEKSLNINAIQL